MEVFIHQQNILFFRKHSAEQKSLSERLLLLRLLAKKEAGGQLNVDASSAGANEILGST